ncbi:MAG: SufD family Fe-S cluster assembly protein [Lachnospiraceae bacterium]|nr:SufD family Fe-S cluster assembly protein [Lachnospiraceae bacterium]
MVENIKVNKLPSKTWYWLGVNDSSLAWDKENTVNLNEENIVSVENSTDNIIKAEVIGEAQYSAKSFKITAHAGSDVTVFETYRTDKNLLVDTKINIEKEARVKLVQLNLTGKGSTVYSKVDADIKEDGKFEFVQLFLGQGDQYLDCKADLNGDRSFVKADMAYIGQDSQRIDVNFVANQFGKNTESEINTDGALKDAATKIFRGTIDFKQGSSDSVGNEMEKVLLLGDDVVNKTIPIILCAEENVVGNHGATIGDLDADTLFYFESRGINREEAQNIMLRANVEHVASFVNDDEFESIVKERLEEVL